MDYNSINNCMSDQQKLSLAASALNQMADNEPKTYDEINDKMTDQQKLSLIAAALQELKDSSSGGGKVLTLSYTTDDFEADPSWGVESGSAVALCITPTITDQNGVQYTLDELMDMFNAGERLFIKNLPIVVGWNGEYGDEARDDLITSRTINTSPRYYSEWEEPGELIVKVVGGDLAFYEVQQHNLDGIGGYWEKATGDNSSAYWRIQKVFMDGEWHIGLFVEMVQVPMS